MKEKLKHETDWAQTGRGGSDTATPDSRALDLNLHLGDDDPACVGESTTLPASEKEDVQQNHKLTKARGFDLDLNAADVSSSINEPLHPNKMHEHLRSRDDSDCVSSVGPLDTKDPMRVWRGLKQNNFLSTAFGAPPRTMPKARGRKKSNHDSMKKKIELAKKEQVDRFASVAAPSGLLNGLNPGIINHVRNSRQVHSIIEALVRSEKNENLLSASKKRSQIKTGAQELSERKVAANVRGSGAYMSGFSHGDGLLGKRQMSDYAFFSKSRIPSRCGKENEDDKLPLKLSSSVAVGTENVSCLSSDESANIGSVTSLSLKGCLLVF